MNLELDPNKKDNAVIYLLAQVLARQEILLDAFLAGKGMNLEQTNKIKADLANDITDTTREVLDHIYREYGLTPDVG